MPLWPRSFDGKTYKTYDDYLNGSHWKRFRKSYIETLEKEACEDCGSRLRLHLHHKTYKNLGQERFDDVKLVCEKCHAAIHNKKLSRTLVVKEKIVVLPPGKRSKRKRSKGRYSQKRQTKLRNQKKKLTELADNPKFMGRLTEEQREYVKMLQAASREARKKRLK